MNSSPGGDDDRAVASEKDEVRTDGSGARPERPGRETSPGPSSAATGAGSPSPTGPPDWLSEVAESYQHRYGNLIGLVMGAATGKSLNEISYMAGISMSSVQRRLREPGIQAMVADYRRDLLREVQGQLAELVPTAIAQVRDSMFSGNEYLQFRSAELLIRTMMNLAASTGVQDEITRLADEVNKLRESRLSVEPQTDTVSEMSDELSMYAARAGIAAAPRVALDPPHDAHEADVRDEPAALALLTDDQATPAAGDGVDAGWSGPRRKRAKPGIGASKATGRTRAAPSGRPSPPKPEASDPPKGARG